MESLLLVQLTMVNWPERNLSEETKNILVDFFFQLFLLICRNKDRDTLLFG